MKKLFAKCLPTAKVVEAPRDDYQFRHWAKAGDLYEVDGNKWEDVFYTPERREDPNAVLWSRFPGSTPVLVMQAPNDSRWVLVWINGQTYDVHRKDFDRICRLVP